MAPGGAVERGGDRPRPEPRLNWASVWLLLAELAWAGLGAAIGWRLGGGWPVGAVLGGVILVAMAVAWLVWLAPGGPRRLVAEDRTLVLLMLACALCLAGAVARLLIETLLLSAMVLVAHWWEARLASGAPNT